LARDFATLIDYGCLEDGDVMFAEGLAAGLVNLTTTLCHSSGEWVRSTWPVCSIEDVASPKGWGGADLMPLMPRVMLFSP
jgi:hypothetical protein